MINDSIYSVNNENQIDNVTIEIENKPSFSHLFYSKYKKNSFEEIYNNQLYMLHFFSSHNKNDTNELYNETIFNKSFSNIERLKLVKNHILEKYNIEPSEYEELTNMFDVFNLNHSDKKNINLIPNHELQIFKNYKTDTPSQYFNFETMFDKSGVNYSENKFKLKYLLQNNNFDEFYDDYFYKTENNVLNLDKNLKILYEKEPQQYLKFNIVRSVIIKITKINLVLGKTYFVDTLNYRCIYKNNLYELWDQNKNNGTYPNLKNVYILENYLNMDLFLLNKNNEKEFLKDIFKHKFNMFTMKNKMVEFKLDITVSVDILNSELKLNKDSYNKQENKLYSLFK